VGRKELIYFGAVLEVWEEMDGVVLVHPAVILLDTLVALA
jgi:hypothetical protein